MYLGLMKTYGITVMTPSHNKQFEISADSLKTTEYGIYEFILEGKTIAYLPIQYTIIVLIK